MTIRILNLTVAVKRLLPPKNLRSNGSGNSAQGHLWRPKLVARTAYYNYIANSDVLLKTGNEHI